MTDATLERAKKLKGELISLRQNLVKAETATTKDNFKIRINTDQHQNLYLHVPEEVSRIVMAIVTASLREKMIKKEEEYTKL